MPASRNILLASLSTSDFDLLAPHLEFVTLELRKTLEKPNKTIEAVYFPETGFASVVAIQRGGKEVEVGLIGREGDHRSPHATYIQAPERVTAFQRTSCGRRQRRARPSATPC